MRRKISWDRRKDRQTEGRTEVKTVYPLRWSGGIKIKKSINLPNIQNFGIGAPFSPLSDYEPSINHEDDHFAKNCIKNG